MLFLFVFLEYVCVCMCMCVYVCVCVCVCVCVFVFVFVLFLLLCQNSGIFEENVKNWQKSRKFEISKYPFLLLKNFDKSAYKGYSRLIL